MKLSVRALLLAAALVAGLAATATPAAASTATHCRTASYLISDRANSASKLTMYQQVCVHVRDNFTTAASLSLWPATGDGDKLIKANLRIELHDCTTGAGFSGWGPVVASNGGMFTLVVQLEGPIRFTPSYAQARITSTYVEQDYPVRAWSGGGLLVRSDCRS